MNKTEHYQLNKPEQDDFYNIDDMNENMDIIENAMLEFENFHHGQMVTIDTDWNNIEPGMHAVNGGSDKSKTWSKELNGPNGARLIGVLLCIGDTASKNFTQIYNEGFVSGIASRRTFIRTCIDGVYGGWMIMASVADVSTAVAKIVADAPADFDTLKEMSDWIAKHQSDASAMNSAIQQNAENIENMTAELTAVKKSVSDGKRTVATAITDKGVTTATDASFKVMSDNVRLMARVQYGYGVTAADARVNTSSASYKSGYSVGYGAGCKTKVLKDYDVVWFWAGASNPAPSGVYTKTFTVSEAKEILFAGVKHTRSYSDRPCDIDMNITISGKNVTVTICRYTKDDGETDANPSGGNSAFDYSGLTVVYR